MGTQLIRLTLDGATRRVFELNYCLGDCLGDCLGIKLPMLMPMPMVIFIETLTLIEGKMPAAAAAAAAAPLTPVTPAALLDCVEYSRMLLVDAGNE